MSLLKSYFAHSPEDLFGDAAIVSWKQKAPYYSGKLLFQGKSDIEMPLINGLVVIERLPEVENSRVKNPISINYTPEACILTGLVVAGITIHTEPFESVGISDENRRIVTLTNRDGIAIPHDMGPMLQDMVSTYLAVSVGEAFQADFATRNTSA